MCSKDDRALEKPSRGLKMALIRPWEHAGCQDRRDRITSEGKAKKRNFEATEQKDTKGALQVLVRGLT